MVGHSGIMEAAIKANEKVDCCIGKLLNSIGKLGGSLLITADHGNSEMMVGPDGQPWTAHTTNPVPVILVEGEKRKLKGYGNNIKLRECGGGLSDLAPTLLHLLNLPKPITYQQIMLIKALFKRLFLFFFIQIKYKFGLYLYILKFKIHYVTKIW